MNAIFRALALTGLIAVSPVPAAPQPAAQDAVLARATPHDRLYSVSFREQHGIAVGEDGLVVRSEDGGKTWQREKAPTSLALIDVATNGRRTVAVGQMGLVLVRDAGGPWRQVETPVEQRLLGVDVNDQGLAIAVGAFGTLLRSTDGGDSWSQLTPPWAELYDSGEGENAVVRDEPTNYVVDVANDGSVIIGGEYGQLLRSIDGGESWQVVHREPLVDDRPQPTVFGLSIRGDGAGYAVGQAGLVLRTDDAGQTWRRLPTPTSAALFAVESFPDGQVVVVGMRAGLRSTDHGASWSQIRGLDLNLNWYTGLAYAPGYAAGQVVAAGHGGRLIRIDP